MLTRATIFHTVRSPEREESRAQLEVCRTTCMGYVPLSNLQFATLLLWKAPERSTGGKWTHTPICYRDCPSTAMPQRGRNSQGKSCGIHPWIGSHGRDTELGNGDGQHQFTDIRSALQGGLYGIHNRQAHNPEYLPQLRPVQLNAAF